MTNRKSALLDSGWQDVQRKTFTKWSPLRHLLCWLNCFDIGELGSTHNLKITTNRASKTSKRIFVTVCDYYTYLYVSLLLKGIVCFVDGQEIMSDVDLGRWNRKPYHRFHFVENCVWALNYIRDNGVALTNIGAEGVNVRGVRFDSRYC